MSAPAFALIVGILYTGLGAFAMLPSLLVAQGGVPYLFGVLAVSGVLNVVHIGIGLWGLAAWSGAYGAVSYARSVAVIFAILAVGGLIAGLSQNAVPLRGFNVLLHALSALAAAYVGLRSAARSPSLRRLSRERRSGAERRRTLRPVAMDRRVAGDRRLGLAP
ncbi:MAG: DUF4383 domain-containing protein [Clostridia bacterium]